MYEAIVIMELYNPAMSLPRDIQQICCSTQNRTAFDLAVLMLSCLGTATYHVH